MRKLIRTLLLGDCGVHSAPYALGPLGFFPYTTGALGFTSAPFAFSSGAILQTYDFCVGERILSDLGRRLAYDTQNQPTTATRHLVDATEIGFFDLCSPVEALLGDEVVNLTYVGEFVAKPLAAAGVDRERLWGWAHSLKNAPEETPARAKALLAKWPQALPGDEVRCAVEALRSRRLGIDDMVGDLEALRERLGAPLAMRLYDQAYAPDGRPIDPAPGFRRQQLEIARRMDLPVLDFAPLVARWGAARLIVDDPHCGHFLPQAYPLLAEIMYDFWAAILGRPYLETYPEWLDVRAASRTALPERIEGPARKAFPGLMRLPRRKRRKARPRRPEDLAVLPLGGPLLHRSLRAWVKAHDCDIRIELGRERPAPHLSSLGEMVQFARLLKGDLAAPQALQPMLGLEPGFSPMPGMARIAHADVVIAQPATPFEIVFGRLVLPRRGVVQLIVTPLRQAYPGDEVVGVTARWLNAGLGLGDESARGLGATLASLVPDAWLLADIAREVLRKARGVRADPTASLRRLRRWIGRPLVLVAPADPDFAAELARAAARLKIPLMAPPPEASDLAVGEAIVARAAAAAGL